MNDKKYIIYYYNGNFRSFCSDEERAKNIISKNTDLAYNEISKSEYNKILRCHNEIHFNVEKISADTIIDSGEYWCEIDPTKSYTIDEIQDSIVGNLVNKRDLYIEYGLFLELPYSESGVFSFALEDQLSLKNLIDITDTDSTALYHTTDNIDTEYTYDELSYIYKMLYNNKIYNQIYTQVLSDWVKNNYTREMYDDKDIIPYGYSNDEILEKVGEVYEQQKLS
jgi:hypothetical protein